MTVYANPGTEGAVFSYAPRYDHFIGGEYVPPANGQYFENPTPVTGAVFTEKIFGWQGMGDWLIRGIQTQDTNITVTVTLFAGVAILVSGFLSDILYAALDPRVRVG